MPHGWNVTMSHPPKSGNLPLHISSSRILTKSINRYFSNITLNKHAIVIVILKFVNL